MNSKELERSYLEKKDIFHKFTNNIKKNSPWDIYTIINPTLIKNPFSSDFPINFFRNEIKDTNLFFLFLRRISKYYLRIFYFFISYIFATILYKIFYKKKRKNNLKILIDIFALVDKNIKEQKFNENYLIGLYDLLEEYKINYSMLIRPYDISKNPFKLIKFFKIINEDKRSFIFEYEFVSIFDFIKLLYVSIIYPFKTLRLLQKKDNEYNKLFNYSLIDDFKYINYESFTRYILGRNLSKIKSIEKIYSWSEFQVIERSFNYGIRKSNSNIELIGLQFYLNYEIYFNTYCDDLDYEMQSSPHKMLVNGKHYILNRDLVHYSVGVSLRYKDIFSFNGIKEDKNILLLGSYLENDTKYMLENIINFKSVIFKNHPAIDIKRLGNISKNITVSSESIYKLFENAEIVIGTASGTAVEAVSCGISVVIIASKDNFTANPLIEVGKGKIWDIVYDVKDLEIKIKNLLEYRAENKIEIENISKWYKDNFFVEPTKENIIKVFEIR
ncbi:hypothetical protein O8C85_05225 [Aliarcobacter butzleri]|uniref:hypothetical protein n=1 Tax=Aliarcobacter butzleri TaxID=28197 RepID=UPI00263D0CC4|nr:hypothetical protein [Aliarcobacter butzleri]MDN5097926.1 hypothetical protein [Aliarcobacter butzleri]